MGLEQYENNYGTTLNGGISNSDTTIVVAAAPVSMTGKFRIKIDNELIFVGSVSGTTFSSCTRGIEGTTAASHSDAATVKHVVTAQSLQFVEYDPIQEFFGTPDTRYEFDTTSFTGLTAMGSADAEDANTTISSHYYVKDNDSTLVGRYASVSTPFTVITKVSEAQMMNNYKYIHLFVGTSSPGKLVTVGPAYSDGPTLTTRVWTGPSDGSPSVATPVTTPYVGVYFVPWYLGIKVVSSTDATYYASRNGKIWFTISANRNDSLTIASAGVAVSAYTSEPAIAAFDYIRIWNSAKTFQAFT